jgi:hypothetical protein
MGTTVFTGNRSRTWNPFMPALLLSGHRLAAAVEYHKTLYIKHFTGKFP